MHVNLTPFRRIAKISVIISSVIFDLLICLMLQNYDTKVKKQYKFFHFIANCLKVNEKNFNCKQ